MIWRVFNSSCLIPFATYRASLSLTERRETANSSKPTGPSRFRNLGYCRVSVKELAATRTATRSPGARDEDIVVLRSKAGDCSAVDGSVNRLRGRPQLPHGSVPARQGERPDAAALDLRQDERVGSPTIRRALPSLPCREPVTGFTTHPGTELASDIRLLSPR